MNSLNEQNASPLIGWRQYRSLATPARKGGKGKAILLEFATCFIKKKKKHVWLVLWIYSLSARYCIPGFFLSLGLGAMRCSAVGRSDELLSVPQGQNRRCCFLVLLSVLDSASTGRLEQVCRSLVSHMKWAALLGRVSENLNHQVVMVILFALINVTTVHLFNLGASQFCRCFWYMIGWPLPAQSSRQVQPARECGYKFPAFQAWSKILQLPRWKRSRAAQIPAVLCATSIPKVTSGHICYSAGAFF